MIRLRPLDAISVPCPSCKGEMVAYDWFVPGMRCLGKFSCGRCARTYAGDLPVGQGSLTPAVLDLGSGRAFETVQARSPFYASWLERSYQTRSGSPLRIDVDERMQVQRPVLLNCLDRMYGHSLLKLLNAQRHLDQGDELVVVVPAWLRWLVPEGVAAVHSVHVPLSEGLFWSDHLAHHLRSWLEPYEQVTLSEHFPHVAPGAVDIARFTGIAPMTMKSWSSLPPQVTFVWRQDRPWLPELLTLRSARAANRLFSRGSRDHLLMAQTRQVSRLAQSLRRRIPGCRITIAGVGVQPSLPSGVETRLATRLDDDFERSLCDLYARSHIVVGVHGSNMLLPSAHAGAVVELVPGDKWSNLLQDLVLPNDDPVQTLLRTRLVPSESSPDVVAEIIQRLLQDRMDLGRTLMLSRNGGTRAAGALDGGRTAPTAPC